MDLGKRIRQARLEAGLSQRQLCAGQITRNMLSLIESGSARPSMETLGYIAKQLGKPVGYFLGETSGSANGELMTFLRQAPAEEILRRLPEYCAPDDVYDRERYFLEAMACLELAEKAYAEEKLAYCHSLLEQGKRAGEKTPFYTAETERARLLLCYRCKKGSPAELKNALPDWEEEVLLRAEAALPENPDECIALLRLLKDSPKQQYLLGEAYLQKKDYRQAAVFYEQATAWGQQVYSRLELCYRELSDYEKAYFYACKQRNENRGYL